MKIALLHHTSWPQFGGVEHVMLDQALLLQRAGHEVTIISGTPDSNPYQAKCLYLEELSRDYPLNASIRAVLERGQSDKNFNAYIAVLMDKLTEVLQEFDLTIVHNIFTTHFNLPLTRALHDLSTKLPMLAWTHDLSAANADYAVPNPTKVPWNLVRTCAPHVRYVAVSQVRADELTTHIKPPFPPAVVPNPIDLGRVYGLTEEMRESLASLALDDRDFIFLMPVRVMLRKNVEMALEIVKKLTESGRNPLLFITGAGDPYSQAAIQYKKFLKDTAPESIQAHLVFVNDYFPVEDAAMRDLYLVSDCVLYLSHHEGFGLPLLEAGLFRLPVWCSEVPVHRILNSPTAFVLDNIGKLPDAVTWLESQPIFFAQRQVRKYFDPLVIYNQYYAPLFASIAATA